jgi:hypothetical protein
MTTHFILSFALLAAHDAAAFAPVGMASLSCRLSAFHSSTSSARNILPKQSSTSKLCSQTKFDLEQSEEIATFDPFGCESWGDTLSDTEHITCNSNTASGLALLAPITALIIPTSAQAADRLSTGIYNPDSFKPVCSASDSFYRFLQGSTRAVVGDENFSEYGPLIAGGLLRIRLELCVVESFFNEAVGPFIKENGLRWILPFHETVETFLAGTIFALATTFILVGSTKLIQIIAFYGDLIVGGPCRLIGGFFFDRARGEPVTLDVSFFGLYVSILHFLFVLLMFSLTITSLPALRRDWLDLPLILKRRQGKKRSVGRKKVC